MTTTGLLLRWLAADMRRDLARSGDLHAQTLGRLWASVLALDGRRLDARELEALDEIRAALQEYQRSRFEVFLAEHPELGGEPRWPD